MTTLALPPSLLLWLSVIQPNNTVKTDSGQQVYDALQSQWQVKARPGFVIKICPEVQ